jgi:hypothetical protein
MPNTQYFVGGVPVFTADDIAEIIDREITWCVEHPLTAVSMAERAYFIRGLTQVKYIIGTMADELSVGRYDA